MVVGGRKQRNRVPTEVSARSKSCGNFEAEVKKAARQVKDADKAVAASEAQVEKAEATAGIARAERDKANGNRIAKLWRLGDWLERWEKKFGEHRHRGPDTFFAKAVKACGNDDIYYVARGIRGPHGYATEEAACKAGEVESLRTIKDRIKLLKREAKSGATEEAGKYPVMAGVPKGGITARGILCDKAKKLRAELGLAEKAKTASEKHVTAVKWRYGQVLAVIDIDAKKKGEGEWETALTEIGDNPQRADENIKIGLHFKSAEDAGKCPVRRALKLIRRGEYAAEPERSTDKASGPPTQYVVPKGQELIMTRRQAQPSAATFTIKPIRELLDKYCVGKGWIDPFAGNTSPAEFQNDCDPTTRPPCHLEALDFILGFEGQIVGALFDPPYSMRQIEDHYKKCKQFSMNTNRHLSDVKQALAKLLPIGGIAITFGWNSNGLGRSNGCEKVEVLLVAHGGPRHDTICTVERKVR